MENEAVVAQSRLFKAQSTPFSPLLVPHSSHLEEKWILAVMTQEHHGPAPRLSRTRRFSWESDRQGGVKACVALDPGNDTSGGGFGPRAVP